jgi:hypothetical protein
MYGTVSAGVVDDNASWFALGLGVGLRI